MLLENQGKAEGTETQAQENEGQENTGTEKVNQERQEEKLYAGVFKTPEELEQGYVNSNKEATRMAQELKRLNAQLQQASTPAKREEIREEITDLTKHFDPETARILSGYFKNLLKTEIDGFQQNSRVQQEFQKSVSDVWEETKKLFPDVVNPQSKLYVRANEILFERGLAELDANGNIKLLSPFAYRMATEAAYSELGMKTSENAGTQARKGQAGMVQGKGSKGFGGGKLTYEQYQKLSDEEKDTYDKQSRGN